MKDALGITGMLLLFFGYSFGPFFGLWASIENGSFFNAIASLAIPFYGIFYWFLG